MFGLQLFGSPTLATSRGREPVPPTRPYQLLVYLASRGGWVSRDAAADLLWPERDTAGARANLRFVLVQIRRLGLAEVVLARGDALSWPMESDQRSFEQACAERRWGDAIAACDGPLLAGFEVGAPAPFAEWLAVERARLQSLWREAVAARLGELSDDPRGSIALASRALGEDALDEAALAALLRAHAALGQFDEARRAYGDYARRLATELGIEPSAALRDLMRPFEAPSETTVAAGESARAAVSQAVAAPRLGGAAPAALVGRRAELAHMRELFMGTECRLLTICGPGGAGKSALARASLSLLAPAFGEGAHWIALDDLHAIEQVAPRCMATLQIEARPATPPQHQLIDGLRELQVLLVFDNAEHLAGFGDWMTTLLAGCARLRAIVTSRVRLDIAGEWLLPLGGLPVPDAEEDDREVLRAFDAVRLFELRAARLQPDFDARAQAADVATLVRSVAGLPLAIELAAAWVRLLPVAEIVRELARSLDLLADAHSGSGRTHSVRDSFEHSWRLLAPAEQDALMRLAVLRGDFARDAALAIADAPLPLLAALADKSLLRATERGRFGLHPLIQQFALEKLALCGPDAEAAARQRHGEHFLARLARYNDFHAIDQRAALQAIGVDLEDMLAAWDWAVAERRGGLIGQAASALESYFDARGQQQFGLDLFDRAMAMLDEAEPSHQLACCHVNLGRAAFRYRRGDFPGGEGAARGALQAARRARYRFGMQSAANTLGLMLWRQGRAHEAAYCLRDVLRRARADGDETALPMYQLNLGRVELELGNADEGERLVREALASSRRVGNVQCIQAALNDLSSIELDHGRPRAAQALAEEGLTQCESSGFRRNAPYFRRMLAESSFVLYDLEASRQHAQAALDAIAAGGDRALEPSCRTRLAWVALQRGQAAAALAELRTAGGLAESMYSPRVQLEVLVAYAAWLTQCGRRDAAREVNALVLGHPAATRRQRDAAAGALGAVASTGNDGSARSADAHLAVAEALQRLQDEPAL